MTTSAISPFPELIAELRFRSMIYWSTTKTRKRGDFVVAASSS
jgi:hypothetical protein